MRYFVRVQDNPAREGYGTPLSAHRMDGPRLMERYDKPSSKWVDQPGLVDASGIGGATDYAEVTEPFVAALIQSWTDGGPTPALPTPTTVPFVRRGVLAQSLKNADKMPTESLKTIMPLIWPEQKPRKVMYTTAEEENREIKKRNPKRQRAGTAEGEVATDELMPRSILERIGRMVMRWVQGQPDQDEKPPNIVPTQQYSGPKTKKKKFESHEAYAVRQAAMALRDALECDGEEAARVRAHWATQLLDRAKDIPDDPVAVRTFGYQPVGSLQYMLLREQIRDILGDYQSPEAEPLDTFDLESLEEKTGEPTEPKYHAPAKPPTGGTVLDAKRPEWQEAPDEPLPMLTDAEAKELDLKGVVTVGPMRRVIRKGQPYGIINRDAARLMHQANELRDTLRADEERSFFDTIINAVQRHQSLSEHDVQQLEGWQKRIWSKLCFMFGLAPAGLPNQDPNLVYPKLDLLGQPSAVGRGGPGSGFFGHAGRPGEVGGSAPEGERAAGSDLPLPGHRAAPESYQTALEGAMRASPYAHHVNHPSAQELRGMRDVLLADGSQAGIAVKDHGDGRIEATALFSGPGAAQGTGLALLQQAVVQDGVNYVECYGPYLPQLYSRLGFAVENKLPFDRSLAPEGWDYERFDDPPYYTLRLGHG